MKRLKILKRKKGRFLSRVITAFMAAGLWTAMSLTAQTPVTINVGSIYTGGTSNNSGSSSESQWDANHVSGQTFLNLKSANGNYTLTGTNANITVRVQNAATDAKITFDDLNIESDMNNAPFVAYASSSATTLTLTLTGNSYLTAIMGGSGVGAFVVGTNIDCTVTGNGSLTATSRTEGAIYLSGSNLNITGTVTVNAIGPSTSPSGPRGVLVSSANSSHIDVGTGVTLNATGYNGIESRTDLTLNINGILNATSNATFNNPEGISMWSGKNLTLRGSGSITVTGKEAAIYTYGIPSILMDDRVTLSITNGFTYSWDTETHTFEAFNPSSTAEWQLTGATTTDPLTNAVINVSVAAGQTGTIKRVGGVKPGDINGDDAVNGADMNILLTNFGKSGPAVNPAADLNSDDAVNGADMNILLTNFGK